MPKRRRLVAGWAVLALSVAAASCATVTPAEPIALRWKYQEGSQLVYRLTNRSEFEVPAEDGSPLVGSSNQMMTLRWTVQSVAPNGDATLAVTTEHMRMELTAPGGASGGELVYDSDTEAPRGPMARLAAAVAGLDYSMVVGADGAVKSVYGTEQFIESAMRGSLRVDDPALMGRIFDEGWFTNMMQRSSQVFPADRVGRGDSWRDSLGMATPTFGWMTTHLTFVLDRVEQDDGRTVALISTTGEMVPARGLRVLRLRQASLADLDMEMTGTTTFDVDRGVTLSSTTTTKARIKIPVDGQSMTMSTTSVDVLELLEYVPGPAQLLSSRGPSF